MVFPNTLVSVVDKCERIVPFLICLLEFNIVAVNGMKKLGETAWKDNVVKTRLITKK